MTTLTQEDRLEELSRQVAFLVEDAERRSRERERWAELVHDLGPVGSQALASATSTLEGVDVSLTDVASLLRELAEALPLLRSGVAQIGVVAELAGTVSELSGPALESLTDRLSQADERGYFAFARGGVGVVDKVVTSFSEEDIAALGENIVLILNTVKEMTQPEVMGMLRRTIHTVSDQDETADPPSMFALLREMRDPQVRRGLSRLLAALRSMGQER